MFSFFWTMCLYIYTHTHTHPYIYLLCFLCNFFLNPFKAFVQYSKVLAVSICVCECNFVYLFWNFDNALEIGFIEPSISELCYLKWFSNLNVIIHGIHLSYGKYRGRPMSVIQTVLSAFLMMMLCVTNILFLNI